MTTLRTILCLLLAVVLFTDCKWTASRQEKIVFAPEERISSGMSRRGLGQDAAVIGENVVKMSVLPPELSEDVSEAMSDRIAVRMMQMITSGGMGVMNTVPGFALAASLISTGYEFSGTAPQKTLANYDICYGVVNVVTGDVYASCTESITGVGRSLEEARLRVSDGITRTPAVDQMLVTGSSKIVAWYEDNFATFKSQVNSALTRGDYALVLALLESVPEQATKAFKYAQDSYSDALKKFGNSIASEELTKLRLALSEAGEDVSTEVYAHFMMVPVDSQQYKEAQKLVGEYESRVKAKAERVTRQEQEAELLRTQHAYEIEMANIETERLKAEYEAEAVRKNMMNYIERGFFGKMGSRVIGVVDSGLEKFTDLEITE